ncbi:MAG TPA: NADH-quinone oxidoreductase subunit L [Cytophagaceae bacterium]
MNSVWLIPLLPLLGFLIIGLFSRFLSKTAVGVIGSGVIGASFVVVLTYLFPALNGTLAVTSPGFDWITTGKLNISFQFLIDPLSVLMMSIITGVGFLIHVYSAGYMHEDDGFKRYFAYLNLFVFSMLLLVMGDNYVVMFAGWEGVGFCSYMLIGFWFKKDEYNNAAKKAFIMNRIGDLGFLLGMLLIFVTFGTLTYTEIFSQISDPNTSIIQENAGVITIITLLLFIGATGKSAQIPLYTWLPDAMAGPTPVSALIHAATMVTAGIYMIVRSNILYSLAPETLEVIQIIGLATAIFAATIGLVQNDIKKVLAYSTVSQLGFMFFALGLGAYTTAMFHLATHAFFKALLFLGSGSVIHAMGGEQDIRKMGGLKKYLPVTYWTFLIGSMAIAGIPGFAGFFSKDQILAHAYEHSTLLWTLALIAALMTAFYMFRLVFLTFFGEFRGTEHQKSHLHESPAIMTIPLAILAFMSVIAGWVGLPPAIADMLGVTADKFGGFLSNVIYPVNNDTAHHALSHAMEWALMGISTIAVLSVIAFAYVTYVSKSVRPTKEGEHAGLSNMLYNKYYIDELYHAIIVKPLNWLSGQVYTLLEVKVIDNFVNAWGKGVNSGSKSLRFVQSGNLSFYLFLMVIGIILILLFNSSII